MRFSDLSSLLRSLILWTSHDPFQDRLRMNRISNISESANHRVVESKLAQFHGPSSRLNTFKCPLICPRNLEFQCKGITINSQVTYLLVLLWKGRDKRCKRCCDLPRDPWLVVDIDYQWRKEWLHCLKVVRVAMSYCKYEAYSSRYSSLILVRLSVLVGDLPSSIFIVATCLSFWEKGFTYAHWLLSLVMKVAYIL